MEKNSRTNNKWKEWKTFKKEYDKYFKITKNVKQKKSIRKTRNKKKLCQYIVQFAINVEEGRYILIKHMSKKEDNMKL